MLKRKNKVRGAIILIWVVVILVGIVLLRLPANKTATVVIGTGAAPVAPHDTSKSPDDAAGIPDGGATATDLQGKALPSDVITNVLK